MAKLCFNSNARTINTKPLKRFWLFLYTEYAVNGGMDDLHSSYDTLQEAVDNINQMDHACCIEEGHIYDSLTQKIMGEVTRISH